MRKVPAVSSFRFPEYKSAHLKFSSSYTPQLNKGVIMKNVSRFLLVSMLLASAAAFAQTGPPIAKPGPTPIVAPGRMPPRLVSQVTPPIIIAKPPTAPMPPTAPRNPQPMARLVSQVTPPIIIAKPPTAPMPPTAPRNPQPMPLLVSQVTPPIAIGPPSIPPNAPRSPLPTPRLG
jgi:hypothetical protein